MDLPEAVQHICERDMRVASRGALTCKKRARQEVVAAAAADATACRSYQTSLRPLVS